RAARAAPLPASCSMAAVDCMGCSLPLAPGRAAAAGDPPGDEEVDDADDEDDQEQQPGDRRGLAEGDLRAPAELVEVHGHRHPLAGGPALAAGVEHSGLVEDLQPADGGGD